MTVQELIDALNTVKDKSQIICYNYCNIAYASIDKIENYNNCTIVLIGEIII